MKRLWGRLFAAIVIFSPIVLAGCDGLPEGYEAMAEDDIEVVSAAPTVEALAQQADDWREVNPNADGSLGYYLDLGNINEDPEAWQGFTIIDNPYVDNGDDPAHLCPLHDDPTVRVIEPGTPGQKAPLNTVKLHSLQPGFDVTIKFCIGNGALQDDWELHVNYGVEGCHDNLMDDIVEVEDTGVMSIVTININGFLVIGHHINLTFFNLSNDGSLTGLWGIYVYQQTNVV
jgi:hypothetical protein